jgi:hypothetical protein
MGAGRTLPVAVAGERERDRGRLGKKRSAVCHGERIRCVGGVEQARKVAFSKFLTSLHTVIPLTIDVE